ncbi:MAG: class IV adenylate cyclase [Desulfovibrionaceae bacterium]
MTLETELKFADADHDALRRTLQSLAAECQGRVFEENAVFDTPDRRLRQADVLLRLRVTAPLDGGGQGRAVLTLKRPPTGPVPPGVKVWDESETLVADAGAMRAVLAGLGYAEAFRYEKVRETWRLGEALVLLDTLPFGAFVEIEAARGVLFACADALELVPSPAGMATYHALNREHRLRHGLPPDEGFVFAPADRAAILAGRQPARQP